MDRGVDGGVDADGAVVVFSGGGTGGHLYPSLALADEVRRIRPDVRVFFLGSERGLEASVLPRRGEAHHLLPVEGFARHEPVWKRIRALVPLLRSLHRTLDLFRGLRPEVVVVTGGYAGGPAGLAAALRRVPLVLQEQNVRPGLVTRILSRWARQVHVAFPEAVSLLPRRARERTAVSGNPVRRPEAGEGRHGASADRRGRARERLGLEATGRVLLVVGGSQGSAALNRILTEAVSGVASGALERPDGVQVLWATGPSHLDAVRDALGGAGGRWLHLTGYIDDMPSALAASDLAVSRAGAMATSEFLAWGLPSVLVPLPSAAAGHQTRNADALDRAGAAIRLDEAGLDGARLWGEAVGILGDERRLASMARAARRRGRPDAVEAIARDIASLLPTPGAR